MQLVMPVSSGAVGRQLLPAGVVRTRGSEAALVQGHEIFGQQAQQQDLELGPAMMAQLE
jgi:hypothetical protein